MVMALAGVQSSALHFVTFVRFVRTVSLASRSYRFAQPSSPPAASHFELFGGFDWHFGRFRYLKAVFAEYFFPKVFGVKLNEIGGFQPPFVG